MTHNESWFKKHSDTIVILSVFVSSFTWMIGKLNEIEKDIYFLKTEIAVVKTVMLMKNILPAELAIKEEK